MKETQLQRAILDYLEIMENQDKCYCFRAGAGMIKTQTGGIFKTGRAGCPDIICCINGKFVGFEVKTPSGKQIPSQKEAEAVIRKNGGEYHVVRSIDDIMNYFETKTNKDLLEPYKVK